MLYVTRLKSNHMVPKDHAKSRKSAKTLRAIEGQEIATSSDEIHWDDTGEVIIWETDTIQEYHMVYDENDNLIPDPNFIIKSVPADRE